MSLISESRSGRLLSGIVAGQRISGSYIFYSPEVTNALEGARFFGRTLFCESSSGCGQCQACLKMMTESFVDYREIVSEKPISVDTIRSIQHYVQYGPHYARYMVIVIHNAHDMTVEAANAFLKSLEEPMQGVCFILTTIHPARLLKTIVSRCQLLDFPVTSPNISEPETVISFSRYCEMPVYERFSYHAELSRDTDIIFSQLSRWLREIQDEFLMGNTRHLDLLKEIVEIISRLEYNLNHRLQLDALAVRIDE